MYHTDHNTPGVSTYRNQPVRYAKADDDHVIVVTFWKLNATRVFNSLFPDLADNWIDDMREFYGTDADDHSKARLPVLTQPNWEHHPTA